MHKNLINAVLVIVSSFLLTHCASNPSYSEAQIESHDIIESDRRAVTESKQQTSTINDQDHSTPYQSTPYQSTKHLDKQINTQRAEYYNQIANNQAELTNQSDAALSSAEFYIQAGNYQQAEHVINTIAESNLQRQQQHRLDVIKAYILFSHDEYDNTLEQLQTLLINARSLEHQHQVNKIQYVDALLLSSFCYQKLNQYETAISVLIERERLLTGSSRGETSRYTWQVINSLSIEQREQIIQQTSNTVVRNRLSQSLEGQFAQHTELPKQFGQWREPVTTIARQTIDSSWKVNSPQRIAVLLPFSSKYMKATQAVMDGINYQHEKNDSPYKPTLDFYDIGENPLLTGQHYFSAVQTGAQMIIGPIGKDYANQLSNNALQSDGIPTILLGGDTYLGQQSTPNISRLAMSPEAEGLAVADRAQQAGHVTAALLVPNNQNGQRTTKAFQQRWLSLGGNISKVISYSPDQFDHSTELKQLFNINESEYRHRQISDTLGFKPHFSAYRRSDVDFIFMVADNKTGRIVRPQINFFSGKKVPVYATSSVFNGIQNPTENIDLEQTRFPVMPWVLQSNEIAPYAGQLNVLFAMGADAYSIAGNYHAMQANSNTAISGKMGTLHLEQSGNIIYQPVWARFEEGVAEPYVELPTFTPSNQSYIGGADQNNGNNNYNDSNWDSRQSSRKISP